MEVNQRTSHTQDFPACILDANEEYLTTSFITLTGCFRDFLANSTGMVISGGSRSAVRSSSPKMAACCLLSMSCMNDTLRFKANRRSCTQGREVRGVIINFVSLPGNVWTTAAIETKGTVERRCFESSLGQMKLTIVTDFLIRIFCE